KSVIGGNLAAQAASAGWPVHFASLEMGTDEVMGRMMSAAAGVKLDRVLMHQLGDDDKAKIDRRVGSMLNWPIWVDETPCSLLQLRSRARTTKRKYGHLGLIVVDYLQL